MTAPALVAWFDAILDGCTPRASGGGFVDVDDLAELVAHALELDAAVAVSHDTRRGRFLVQELTHEGDVTNAAQRLTLERLACLDPVTVWTVERRRDGRIGWLEVGAMEPLELLTVHAYRVRAAHWWGLERPLRDPAPELLERHGIPYWAPAPALTWRDIRWGMR